jgi:hypothetical protein
MLRSNDGGLFAAAIMTVEQDYAERRLAGGSRFNR